MDKDGLDSKVATKGNKTEKLKKNKGVKGRRPTINTKILSSPGHAPSDDQNAESRFHFNVETLSGGSTGSPQCVEETQTGDVTGPRGTGSTQRNHARHSLDDILSDLRKKVDKINEDQRKLFIKEIDIPHPCVGKMFKEKIKSNQYPYPWRSVSSSLPASNRGKYSRSASLLPTSSSSIPTSATGCRGSRNSNVTKSATGTSSQPSSSATKGILKFGNRKMTDIALALPLRERVIHLLAIRTYTRPELLLRLMRDGLKTEDYASLDVVLDEVSVRVKDRGYTLDPDAWQYCRLEWPLYTSHEKVLARRLSIERSKQVPKPEPSTSARNATSGSLPSTSTTMQAARSQPCTSARNATSGSLPSTSTTMQAAISGSLPVARTTSRSPRKRPCEDPCEMMFIRKKSHTFYRPRLFRKKCIVEDVATITKEDSKEKDSKEEDSKEEESKEEDSNEEESKEEDSKEEESNEEDSKEVTSPTFNLAASESNCSMEWGSSTLGGATMFEPIEIRSSIDSAGAFECRARDLPDLPSLPVLRSTCFISKNDCNEDYFSPRNYIQQYNPIHTCTQRNRYTDDFYTYYAEYRVLHVKMTDVATYFQNLKETLYSMTESPEINKIYDQLQEEYSRKSADSQYLMRRRRMQYLYGKLSHLKRLIDFYDCNIHCHGCIYDTI